MINDERLSGDEARLLISSVEGACIYDGSPARLAASRLCDEGLVELSGSGHCGDHTDVKITKEGLNYILGRLQQ